MIKRFTCMLLVVVFTFLSCPVHAFSKWEYSTNDNEVVDSGGDSILSQLDFFNRYNIISSFIGQRFVTRAELCEILCKLLKKGDEAAGFTDKNNFKDVPSDFWASGYVNFAFDAGFVSGDGNGMFRPNDIVKRDEAVKMIVCATGYDVNLDAGSVHPRNWIDFYIGIASAKSIVEKNFLSENSYCRLSDISSMLTNAVKSKLNSLEANPPSGTYFGSRTVKLTCDYDGVDIYYTLDGTEPTLESPKYFEGITVSSTSILKAMAVKDGIIFGDVITLEYIIHYGSSGGSSGGNAGGDISSDYLSVYFDLNYETDGDSILDIQKMKKGENFITPLIPEREGYVFVGWYYDKECLTPFVFYSKDGIQDDITLYAKWIDVSDPKDSDGDGLLDYAEDYFKTDSGLADTDSDGISDYIEIAVLGTDPLNPDTDGNGVKDSDEDSDSDGISNLQEIINNTDPALPDSDFDGLSDKDEIEIYLTDPLNRDTDDDGVSDGKEIKLLTDPLNFDESFEIEVKSDNFGDPVIASTKLSLSGSQVESLVVNRVNDKRLFPENMPGYMGSAYEFNVAGEFDSALIRFQFDKESIDRKGVPTIYYYNEEEQILEELPTTVNGNIAEATVSHFSKYILINKTLFDKAWEEEIKKPGEVDKETSIDIAFVIDYSHSMTWNDGYQVRKDVAKEFVDRLRTESGDRAAVITFISEAYTLCELTDDKELLRQSIDSIVDDNGYNYLSGTNGSAGLKMALDELAASAGENRRQFIIFLTDGEDTKQSYSYEEIIRQAVSSDISIYSIGLGSSVNTSNLSNLASSTNGKYYNASVAEELIEIFEKTAEETIDYVSDTDSDGIPDYYEDRLKGFNGLSLGLDRNNPDTDRDGLLDGEEIDIYVSDDRVYGFIRSYPNLKDSDGDGIGDKKDSNPMSWDVRDRDLGIFSQLSYYDEYEYNNRQFNDEDDFLGYASSSEVTEYWDLVDSSGDIEVASNTRFYAAAYKNENNIVIAYRGTDSVFFDDQFGEWINNIVGGITNHHVESSIARSYADMIARRYPLSDIYITGHSLGGHLAQLGAAKILDDHPLVNIKRVSYFNAFGINTNPFFNKNAQLDIEATLKKHSHLLVSHSILGDVVSKLGEHFGLYLEYKVCPKIENGIFIGMVNFKTVHKMCNFMYHLER